MAVAAGLLEPLVAAMLKRVLQSEVIQTDDTPVPVQDHDGKGIKTGRLWVQIGDWNNPFITGMAQARKEGRPHDRPRSASLQFEEIARLKSDGVSHSEIARRLEIGRTSWGGFWPGVESIHHRVLHGSGAAIAPGRTRLPSFGATQHGPRNHHAA